MHSKSLLATFVATAISLATTLGYATVAYSQVVPLTYTPALISSMNPPIPVVGTDGKVHVVYELMMANASSWRTNLTSIEVLDGNDHSRVLKKYSGDELTGNATLLLQGKPTSVLGPSESATVWFQLEFDRAEDVPDLIAHRVTCEPQFPNKAGVPLLEKSSVSISENLKVDKVSVPVIGPPLEGDKWIAIGGIGTNMGHRRAMLPLNNELYLSQRFANDWMQLDDENRSVHGDVKKVGNYTCYGKRALAVADATVVEAIDKLPDQVIGKPSRLHITEIGGNYVILDLGNKLYAFYAHLKPGSVKVRAGDKVKRGQEVGLVGNVGNSTAPHLHFHICDRPSPMAANGIPFVIDSMKVRGNYKSQNQYFDATDHGKPVEIVTDGGGDRTDQMPVAGVIVDFPTPKL